MNKSKFINTIRIQVTVVETSLQETVGSTGRNKIVFVCTFIAINFVGAILQLN